MAEKRVNYSSGAPLEEKVGYSRMVKVGDHIYMLVEQRQYSRMVQCMEKMPMSRPDMYLRSR